MTNTAKNFLPHFELRADGVYQRREHETKDGGIEVEWKRVCSPLEVAALVRNTAGEAWGRWLVITDADGRKHSWAMPMSMLAGGGDGYREQLLHLGLEIMPGMRKALEEYIITARPENTWCGAERVGWHDRAFVLP